jgi:hypothetical protein
VIYNTKPLKSNFFAQIVHVLELAYSSQLILNNSVDWSSSLEIVSSSDGRNLCNAKSSFVVRNGGVTGVYPESEEFSPYYEAFT